MRGSLDIAPRERSRLATTVAALRRPASYPEATTQVEAIETHMAWVFLTDTHAYKLKKPLRTRLIDYTTAAARRRACHTEMTLNRRLAAPVYRAVVPVTTSATGRCVGGDGPTVDWLVQMRRLPHLQMLDARIERGPIRTAEIRRLGAKLSAFYDRASPLGWSAASYCGRLAANIRAKGASLNAPRYGLDRRAVEAVTTRQLRWLAAHRHLVGRRGQRVVDAHGDLRPAHVCLTTPPMIIDCLEFNRSLRLLDPLADLSFLSLECRRLGAAWIGTRLLAHYRTQTHDAAPPALIPFYESYHALVRAAIAIWHLDDDTVGDPEHWRRQARTYLRLARERL
jgi:aminoglycoside phosphotransferase family enzyme